MRDIEIVFICSFMFLFFCPSLLLRNAAPEDKVLYLAGRRRKCREDKIHKPTLDDNGFKLSHMTQVIFLQIILYKLNNCCSF